MNQIVYSHEHMVIDLSKGKNNPDCYLNAYEEGLDELKELKEKGVEMIVDCSNHGIGVDWDIISKIEKEVGIKIIRSTGFYKDPFLPSDVEKLSVEELSEMMLKDIKNGAQVIGEIGTSKNEMTPSEQKVFEAACIAQKKTDVIIITHTTLGTMAIEQVKFFKEHGIDLSKVIISHTALADDYQLMKDLASTGVNLAFDTIGKLNYLSDEKRSDYLIQLVNEGFENQIVMSMDLTRQSHLKKNGGKGYSYLLDNFVPLLRKKGLSEKVIEQILCHNFKNILAR